MARGLPAAVVFDLDGTLIDSVPEVRAALNAVLAGHGRRAIAVDEALAMVGEGAVVTLERAFAATGAALAADAVPELMREYLDAYKAAKGANTVVYPGVRDVLDHLRANGTAMTVCTNKPAATTAETLRGLDLFGYFDRVVCPEDTPFRKPDGRHVLACLDLARTPAAHAVMVGDSETDMAAARDAGLRFVAVSYGYSHVPIADLAADAVIDTFDTLLDQLRALG